ncbi:unnamed protein product [Gadus morhua 'NCC']
MSYFRYVLDPSGSRGERGPMPTVTMDDDPTVTRSISAGAVSGGSDGAPSTGPAAAAAARRHSSAGMRALLWAAHGARSLGSSLGSGLHSRRDGAFPPHILTPGSAPPFTIPSLSLQPDGPPRGRPGEEEEEEEEEEEGDVDEGLGAELASSLSVSASRSELWRTTSSSSDLRVPPPDRRAQRTVSDPLRRGSLLREGSYPGPYREEVRRSYQGPYLEDAHRHGLDPASRAALSLPHLAKVTTPYGFVTLSQSPQRASEEVLLCPVGPHRAPAKRDAGPSTGGGGGGGRAKAPLERTGGAGDRGPPPRPPLGQRSSEDSGDARTEAAATAAVSSQRGASKKPKRRLYDIIRKHILPLH